MKIQQILNHKKQNVNIMNEESFNEDELRKADLQYQITIKSATSFNIGEKVFLKSNPELILVVNRIYEESNGVWVEWLSKKGRIDGAMFQPETILPFTFAGLVIWKNHYMCLN